MKKIPSKVGQVIGHIEVVRLVHKSGQSYSKTGAVRNEPVFECKCLLCGKVWEVTCSTLCKKNFVGCQCYRGNVAVKQTWFRKYKVGAKRRGLEFQISLEEFITLCESPCRYCGKIGHTTTTTGGVWSEWNHNGVDRIDPTCGYVLSNCQPACWRCNRMKANLSEEKFLTKIRLIYEHKLHQS